MNEPVITFYVMVKANHLGEGAIYFQIFRTSQIGKNSLEYTFIQSRLINMIMADLMVYLDF